MKEVIAIIRLHTVKETKRRLAERGVVACHQVRIQGRGKEGGLRYRAEATGSIFARRPKDLVIRSLPRMMLTCLIDDDRVEPVVKTIIEANQSGAVGDGRIFVCPVEEAIRIRTGDRGPTAL